MTTTEHDRQLLGELEQILNAHGKAIPLISSHDENSRCCSGAIVAIQILCKCQKLSGNIHNSTKNYLKICSSNEVSR